MDRSNRWWPLRLSCLVALCAPACVADFESQQEASAELASTITVSVTTNAPSWPRQICFTGDHAHSPYLWQTSWAGLVSSSSPTICTTVNGETCGVWARVVQDTPPGGFLPHSSLNSPSVNAIDVRSFQAPPSSQTLPTNETAYLSVPAPHAARHCDGQGSFYWEMYDQFTSAWSKINGTDQLNPAAASSPTEGSETYRIRCSHPQGAHTGTSMTVNWVTAPSAPTCSLSCVQTTYPSFNCTITASAGTGSYSYYSSYNGQAWNPIGSQSNWICKYLIPGYTYSAAFKAIDAAGNECQPQYWYCGLNEL